MDICAAANRFVQREQARARRLVNTRPYPNRHDRKMAAGFLALVCPGPPAPSETAAQTKRMPAAIVEAHAEARWQRVVRRWETKHA